jgi:16S rRNA (guanine966-N2)-methyltransferase
MRVIAGSAKGRQLVRVPAGVRPVSDKAREGLFSSLGARVEGARVLDLYAGTGALGIEALSRGAEEAVFVDRNPASVAAIRSNLDRTGFRDRGLVTRADVSRYLDRFAEVERGFDLVFLDPPYETSGDEVGAVLARLGAGSVLRTGATVALSRGSRSSNDVIPVDWAVAKRLSYGDSVITLFRSGNLEV